MYLVEKSLSSFKFHRLTRLGKLLIINDFFSGLRFARTIEVSGCNLECSTLVKKFFKLTSNVYLTCSSCLLFILKSSWLAINNPLAWSRTLLAYLNRMSFRLSINGLSIYPNVFCICPKYLLSLLSLVNWWKTKSSQIFMIGLNNYLTELHSLREI